jgi:hypothetical protein
MTEEELSQLSDQEFLAYSKQRRSSAILHASLIGFSVGIIIYSIANSTWGLVTLIPIFFVYRLTRGSNDTVAFNKELKRRGLN